MNEHDVGSYIASRLSARFPQTVAQLTRPLKAVESVITPELVLSVLSDDSRFVLAGSRPPSWRLAGLNDASTELCSGCGLEWSVARFRDAGVLVPRCFDCEVHGVKPRKQDSAARERATGLSDAVLEWQRQGLAETAGRVFPDLSTRRGSGLVFITRGGSVYHLREDCSALRHGQAEAIGAGKHLHPIECVPIGAVGTGRRGCASCAF